jgi:lactoylglutathione lyase
VTRGFFVPLLLLAATGAMAEQTPQSAATVTEIMGPAIRVSDVKKSIDFYRDGLGMAVRGEFGAGATLETMLVAGNKPESPMLILLSAKAPAEPSVITHGNGYGRLVVRVSQIGGIVLRLHGKGYAATEPRAVAGLYCMAMATDPDGYKIEMVEKQGDGGQCNGS